MEWIYLVTAFLLAVQIVPTDGILCYQCSDSTEDRSKATCQYATGSLAKQRTDLKNGKRSIGKLPNIKNCSNYRDDDGNELFKYCKLEIISSFGETRGYIRECSDGTDFSEDFKNTTRISRQLGFVKVDNQTTCGYSKLQFANICVKLCDTDLCNGPLTGTAPLNRLSLGILSMLYLVHRLFVWL